MNNATWLIYRSCINKKSYDKNGADAAIDRFSKKGLIYYYYKCELCNRYHLTRKEPDNMEYWMKIV